ncbi:MAG: response regulator [Rhodospirillales bacterium]|jgi:two-component system cell cycle response regulator CpdR|nr:response regulator [Rhodospirillales bacterium]
MARILLAEDDDNMRVFLARALERAGHQVVAVGDGNEALEYAAAGEFELLLADVVMPGLDGIELARRASVVLPELRVMFITGFAAVALNQSGFARRQPKVLAKPFHLRQLVLEIDKMLGTASVSGPGGADIEG